MKIYAKLLILLFMPLYYTSNASTTPAPLSIKEATAFCEANVPLHCIAVTCPQYCDTLRSENAKSDCKLSCTQDKRCKLKPLAGQDDPKNAALDADNRDKLIACIAEKRDPEGKKSGRRMEAWQNLMTPSLAKVLNRS